MHVHEFRVRVITANGRDQSGQLCFGSVGLSRLNLGVPSLDRRPKILCHGQPITALHRPPESRVHLKKVGNPLSICCVDSRLMESRWIKEDAIALLQL